MKPKVVSPGVVEMLRPQTEGFGLIMRAENIRTSPTGIHAKLSLYGTLPNTEAKLLAGTVCNIERDEERTKLLNTARRQGADKSEAVMGPRDKQEVLKRDFDVFCFAVWETLMATQDPQMVSGDAMLPLAFRAKPHIIEGGGTILFGPPESLKSTTALIIGVAVDAGVNGLWETDQGYVLYVNLERSADSLQRRLGQINEALGLAADRPFAILNARGRTLVDARHSVEREMQRRRPSLIIVDSLTRMGAGDLVSNEVANNSMDMLNGMCETWVAIGHSPRADSTHLYGSVMYDSAADVMVKITASGDGDTRGVRLDVTKVNDFRRPPPMTLRLGYGDSGLTAIDHARPGEFEDLEPKTDKGTIRNYLLEEAGKATATQISSALKMPRRTVVDALHDNFQFVMVDQIGREKFYAVVTEDRSE